MRLDLVRHGQSDWQLHPGDDLDAALSPLGHEQSRRLAGWLAQGALIDPDTVLDVAGLATSPMRRAQQTTGHVIGRLGLPACPVPELAEASFHVAAHLPSRTDPRDPRKPYRPSEAYAGYREQVQAGFTRLLEQAEAAGGSVLAVTHGGFIKTLLRIAVGQDDLCFQIYNTGITQLRWRRGRWHLTQLNLLDHLEPDLRTR